MLYYTIKIGVTVTLVIVISEISKRSSMLGAILASVPIVSVLAIVWLYKETKNIGVVSDLTKSIFWMVLPSLAFFLALPPLLKTGLNFYAGICLALAITVGCYLVMITALNLFGIRL